MDSIEGEEINKENSKNWRDKLLDSLPFKQEELLLVNMPDPKASNRGFDDTLGHIFVFAGYLKPGRH